MRDCVVLVVEDDESIRHLIARTNEELLEIETVSAASGCRQRVEQHFSAQAMATGYLAAYATMLGKQEGKSKDCSLRGGASGNGVEHEEKAAEVGAN